MRLPFEEIFRLSSIIQKKFLSLKELENARQLALYASFKNEVLTDTILEYALGKGKDIFFPRVVRGRGGLAFLKVNGKKDLAVGSYEIHEPSHGRWSEMGAPSSFDIIVVPGIAFDINGNRLGYGKGYYDRALGGIKKECLIAALAFDFQIADKIPAESHDIKMGKIITESRVINPVRS